MAQQAISDHTAKLLREAWYKYLDTIELARAPLYRYCRRLTGRIWDAEDLLQDTLLKGFGAIGRSEVLSESAQVKDPRAVSLPHRHKSVDRPGSPPRIRFARIGSAEHSRGRRPFDRDPRSRGSADERRRAAGEGRRSSARGV